MSAPADATAGGVRAGGPSAAPHSGDSPVPAPRRADDSAGSVATVGVLLMTYGSPATLDEPDVARYLANVRGGRPAPAELVTEFTRRYRIIGGSPLISITRAQATALQAQLGDGFEAAVGMRFSEPTIADGLRELASAGARRVVAIILSPQYSPLIMGGYERDLGAARASLGDAAPEVAVSGAWHLQPDFIRALAERIREGLRALPEAQRATAPVLLTAHSLPRRVAEQEPGYLEQLCDTAAAAADAAGLPADRWRFCWQSAGHEPGEWMKPDFADLMPQLRSEGHRSVLVAPVQFLADHLEILYDVEVGAREQADAAGMEFHRIESLNTMPRFITALAAVARETAGIA